MANIVARLIVGQRIIRVIACDQSEQCGGKLHLHLQVVENGSVVNIAQIFGENTEAIQRSGSLMRMVAVMVHGEDVSSDILFPRPDDDAGVLPGTRVIQE